MVSLSHSAIGPEHAETPFCPVAGGGIRLDSFTDGDRCPTGSAELLLDVQQQAQITREAVQSADYHLVEETDFGICQKPLQPGAFPRLYRNSRGRCSC